jgi:hypothetical protein
MCALSKRKFSKLTSKTKVSFVNEAPGLTVLLLGLALSGLSILTDTPYITL